jgi:peptidoglycan/xylan/chitin deacetylase (PgdA/CDA1 family)
MTMGLRQWVWEVFRWTGVLRLWRFLHRREIVILMLHGVMDAQEPAAWMPLRPQLSRRRFQRTLRILARHYQFVSLDEAVAMLSGKAPLRPYSMVLTFDDGYRNNFTHALPILRMLDLPATFFVATGHVDGRRPFWFDRLDYALQHAAVDGREVRVGPRTVRLRGADRATLDESYRELRHTAKALRRGDDEMRTEMETLAVTLETESGRAIGDIFERDPWSAVATWDEVRAAAADPRVSIGSHTVDHVRLDLVGPEVVVHELRASRAAIERELGRPCAHLAYPNGSFSRPVAETARAQGYVSAVTTVEGGNRLGVDLMMLRRVSFPEQAGEGAVLAEVSGLGRALRRLRGASDD